MTEQWKGWRITERVQFSSGGGGDVFRCRLRGRDGVEQTAVLKLTNKKHESAQNLIGEARLLATLQHPNIIQLRDYGTVTADGVERGYLLMQDGGSSLAQILLHMDKPQEEHDSGNLQWEDGQQHKDRVFEPGLAIHIATEVASALQFAHDHGTIHRDIKPGNVLVGLDGQVRVIDFGIAKSASRVVKTTEQAKIKGTLSYLSPEQLIGKPYPIDHRADLWAVGVMLYEILTGRTPWVPDPKLEKMAANTDLARKICEKPAPTEPLAHVPRELAAIVLQLLAKNRDDRQADAVALLKQLDDIALLRSPQSKRLGLSPWVARRELAQISNGTHNATTTRTRRPKPDANTVPLSADARRPAAKSELELPGSIEVAEDMGFSTDELGYETDGGTSAADRPPPRREGLPAPREEPPLPSHQVGEITTVIPSIGRKPSRLVAAAVILVTVAAAGVVAWQLHPPKKPESADALASSAPPAPPALPSPPTPPAPPPLALKPAKPSLPPSVLKEASPERAEPVPMVVPVSDPAPEQQPPKKEAQRPERKRDARLAVAVIPRGAFVRLDNRKPRRAPASFENIRPGRHTIRIGIDPEDWSVTRTVRLESGANQLEYELASNPFDSPEAAPIDRPHNPFSEPPQ